MKKYKTGILFSTFDLLHAGHILMLKDASNICEYLIVGLHIDPTIERKEKNKPIQSLDERFIQLEAIKYINKIVTYKTEDDLIKILKFYKPDIRILGSDYEGNSHTGEELNIPIYYHNRNYKYSSSELRERIYNEERKLRG